MKIHRKSIVIVFNSLEIGGIENRIVDITTHLTKNYPHLNVILCLKLSGGPLTKYLSPKVQVLSPQRLPFISLLYPFWLSKILKKIRPDTVFSLGNYSAICAAIAIKSSHIKTYSVISEDSSIIDQLNSDSFSYLRKMLVKITYPLANSIIALSSTGRNHLVKLIPKISSKTTVVPVWLLSKYQPQKIKPKKDIDILFLGRLVPQKNPLRFVRIIKLLTIAHPHLKCLMVGSGPLNDSVIKLIIKLNLSKNLSLLSATISPEDYFKRAKFFLLSSRHEGFPLVLLESHACRCLPIMIHLSELNSFYNKKPHRLFFKSNHKAVTTISYLISHPQKYSKLVDYYYHQVYLRRILATSKFYKILFAKK